VPVDFTNLFRYADLDEDGLITLTQVNTAADSNPHTELLPLRTTDCDSSHCRVFSSSLCLISTKLGDCLRLSKTSCA
jgi:hypothetical protein